MGRLWQTLILMENSLKKIDYMLVYEYIATRNNERNGNTTPQVI